MKAFLAKTYGDPSELKIFDIPVPKPGEGEVLVKVKATTVNDFDWSLVTGKPAIYKLLFGISRPKRPIPGMELAGVIEAIGSGVSHFKPGDRVYGDISAKGWGTYAEYACVHESTLVHMPDEMSFEEAAAIPHASMLAYQALVTLGKVKDGQRILINGAGGGMGTFAVQIAKQYDVELTGVDTAGKAELMLSQGFDHVIDYRKEDFTRSGIKYDLIIDARTKRRIRRFLKVLVPGGRYVTVGGDITKLLQVAFAGPLITLFTSKNIQLLALRQNKDLKVIEKLYREGKLSPVIDGPYTFEEIPRLIEEFGNATHKGKIVVSLGSSF